MVWYNLFLSEIKTVNVGSGSFPNTAWISLNPYTSTSPKALSLHSQKTNYPAVQEQDTFLTIDLRKLWNEMGICGFKSTSFIFEVICKWAYS